MTSSDRASPDVASILARVHRPRRAVVTAGMPYANGPLHLGHLAGAHVPADIHARWLGMVIGRHNVLYVCGTDEHGTTEKMSKSRGNFLTGDQLLDDGHSADQIRYYLALLGLSEKPASFDFDKLTERNRFLAGPMNATFERPISAAHSKFGGRIPAGTLADKLVADTARIVGRYVRGMERADYPTMLYEVENYARIINSLFNQHKPHDDRRPEPGRRDALHASFYVLKNLMIMLYPFAPTTMDRVRESLRLPPEVLRIDELGQPLPAGHEVGAKQAYFPGEPERTSQT